ncbi:MAG: ATP-binding protein [Planctomycetota bacterium]
MAGNPFSTRYTRPGAMPYRYAVDASENRKVRSSALTESLQQLRLHRCGVIVGPHGSGKTTLLHDWRADLENAMSHLDWIQVVSDPHQSGWRGRFRIADGRAVLRRAGDVPTGGLLIIDGAEQLSRLARFRIRNRVHQNRIHCLMTAHANLPGFKTLFNTGMDTEILRYLLNQLATDYPSDSVDQLDQVENVREFWSELYDHHVQWDAVRQSPCR